MDTALLIAVCLLGHPNFDVRERANQYLVNAGPAAHAYVVAATKSGDAEVAFRSQRILEHQRITAISKLIAANRPLPWIDALGPETEGRSEIINEFLGAARLWREHEDCRNWPHWRDATEMYLWTLSAHEAGVVLSKMPRGKYWGGSGWTVPPSQ